MWLRVILSDIFSSRELVVQLVSRDIRLKYRQAAMGVGWALMMPLLTIAAGLVIRGALSSESGGQPSLAGIAVKSWAWAFFAGALTFATNSLLNNIALITKVWFPREALPISSVLAQLFDAGVGLVVLGITLGLLGVTPSLALLWLLVLLPILAALTLGVSLVLSCANLYFRDIKYILQVLLTFGIFFTPVVFEPAQMGLSVNLIMLNPLAPIFEGLRLSVVEQHHLFFPIYVRGSLIWAPIWLAYSGGVASLTLIFGFWVFRRGSRNFAEIY